MRQVWITKAGPPETLAVRAAPDPVPGPGEMRVRVAAAGINFADLVGRMGLYPDLPKIPVVPGYEVAGVVDAVGADVAPAWVGRDVLALTRFGGYADVVCVPERQVFERPPGMTAEAGAAFPVNYLTAWQLIVVMGALQQGQTMLVHGAGGGVGIAATQLARKLGARVIGTASAGKHEALRALGVDECIDYTREDFEARTRALTNGRGVDLALDPVGGRSLQKSYRALAPSGRLGVYGLSAAAPGKRRSLVRALPAALTTLRTRFAPIALMNANKGVFGVNVGHLWGEIDRLRGWMEALLRLHREGALAPVIAARFSFDDAPKAHHYIHDRKNLGKVLLLP